MNIEISVLVHPTESKSKVEKALKTLFPTMEFTLSGGQYTGKSRDVACLNHFKELLEMQRIRDTANTILKRSLCNDNLLFHLNKQAAFVGKVNFSEKCPLDPITVSIRGKNLINLISNISPRTTEL
ncbi:MAG: hypothetical protein HXS54_08930 [Theionarchaea archaeon]|nr:hypothetical protein [Theionarchaea archaeon]